MKLYHFTDERNIPSIKKHGLLSWNRLITQGISHVPGSNDLSRGLDARRNLEDYVRLSLDTENPMAYIAKREGRVGNLVWLEIDELALRNAHVMYANDNATANRTTINFDIQTVLNSSSKQREVLVKGVIPPQYIKFPGGYQPTVTRTSTFSQQSPQPRKKGFLESLIDLFR